MEKFTKTRKLVLIFFWKIHWEKAFQFSTKNARYLLYPVSHQLSALPIQYNYPIAVLVDLKLSLTCVTYVTGLANMVYPGAVHSRFEHSLGVYWLAGVTIQKIIDHQVGKIMYLVWSLLLWIIFVKSIFIRMTSL